MFQKRKSMEMFGRSYGDVHKEGWRSLDGRAGCFIQFETFGRRESWMEVEGRLLEW